MRKRAVRTVIFLVLAVAAAIGGATAAGALGSSSTTQPDTIIWE
jgi:hypothetical protein